MSGGIIRIERNMPGAYVPNATAHDSRLRLDTLGLLTWLLAHGDGRTVMMGPLIATCAPRAPKARGGGRDWVRRMLAELEAAGYVRRTRAHGPDGTWVWQSVISDMPMVAPTIDGSAVDGSADDGQAGDISPITPPSNDSSPLESKSRAQGARKSTPAKNAGGGIDPEEELRTDPIMDGIVGNVVQEVRSGKVKDLRAVIVKELGNRGLPPAGAKIAAIIAAVHSRVPVRSGEGKS